jgi:hypothetical protein
VLPPNLLHIDAGHGRTAVAYALGVLVLTTILRAAAPGHAVLAVTANALGALAQWVDPLFSAMSPGGADGNCVKCDSDWTTHKRWKLSYEDFGNRSRRTEYEVAIEDMMEKTSTENAPWHLVPTNDKPYRRLASFTILIERLGEGLSLEPRPLDPKIAEAAARLFALGRIQRCDQGR